MTKKHKEKRSSVEIFFGWLKVGFRRLETRKERLAATFLGLIRQARFITPLAGFSDEYNAPKRALVTGK